MLLVFVQLGLRIMVVVGGPMVLILAPVFIFLGGGAAKKDLLSWQGIGNVWYSGNADTIEEKDMIDDVQWIYWLLALATWYVVIMTQQILMQFMKRFMRRRKAWMREQPLPQSHTIMVEFLPIPPLSLDPTPETETVPSDKGSADGTEVDDDDDGKRKYWDDEYLKAYFDKLFPGEVESAYVVRKSSELTCLVDSYAASVHCLEQDHAKDNADKLDKMRDQIRDAQEDFKRGMAEKPHEWYAQHGFVIFKKRIHRMMALTQRISDDFSEFEISSPPLPQDVIYEDLETDSTSRRINMWVARMLVFGLFLAFMPIVLFIGSIANLQTLESSQSVKHFLRSTGLEHTVGGVLASLGITIMMSFLPTFLMYIYDLYCNKSSQWKQLALQRSYFWFLVTFVLLVTAVGSNFSETLVTLAHRPFNIFTLLANRMPLTTHFYLNYCVMQPVTHGMNLTRYFYVMKYYMFKKIGFKRDGGGRSEQARFMAEPEAQDYYGIGSRSARFAFMLAIGLVYGTICPLMNVVVIWNFVVMRVVYGYLMPCAEMRKNDLGGEAFVQQIKHISQSLIIYVVLMVGILSHRATSSYPAIICSFAFVFWTYSYETLLEKEWEHLSLHDIMVEFGGELQGKVERRSGVGASGARSAQYSQRLDDIYLVPYEQGGEKLWCDHYLYDQRVSE